MMDSENYTYPCTGCVRDGNCTGEVCAKWKKWFGEKWQEVTEVLRQDESI